MARTDSKSGSRLTQPRSGFVLINRDGFEICRNVSAAALAEHAKCLWPDQEQDPERTGKGWDVQVVGA